MADNDNDDVWVYDDDRINDFAYSVGDFTESSLYEESDIDFSYDDVMNAFENGFLGWGEHDSEWYQEQREEFFEYIEALGFEYEDFDWEGWREWLESVSAGGTES